MNPALLPQFTADDWGLSPGVNQGILELARLGIVKRVSCIANSKFLRHGLEELLQVKGIQLGIHFNVTSGQPLALEEKSGALSLLLDESRLRQYRSAQQLFRLAVTTKRAILYSQMKQALVGQWRFLIGEGLPITYLDGHHHIHLLPGLMNVLGPTLVEGGITTVRLPLDPQLAFVKRAVVFWLAVMAKPSVDRLGLRALPCRYPTLSQLRSNHYVRRLLRNPNTEVIVHPARESDFSEHGIKDPYAAPRVEEFSALKGFLQWERETRE